MFGKKIISGLNGFKVGRTNENFYGIMPIDDFRIFIEREIRKVDRNTHIFSLVIFCLNQSNGKKPHDLVRNLQRRLRITDQIGWFDHYNIGAFLPDTTAEGATKLAQSIYSHTFHPFTIYTYPNDWFPRDKDDTKSGDTSTKDEKDFKKVSKGYDLKSNSTTEHNLLGSLFNPLPFWKRLFDISLAILSIVVLSPFVLSIAIFIKIVSSGPIFFKQTRLGYLGRPFTFWKFRTMYVDAGSSLHEKHMREIIKRDHQDQSGTKMKKLDSEEDPRIIPFGKILRQSCLDELPQLLNVLRGEMSFVGPRPCMPYEAEEYQLWHTRRFDVVPGITGSWQVNGKNKTTFKEMVRLDISYYLKRSFGGDLKILFKTFPAIIQLMIDGFDRKKA